MKLQFYKWMFNKGYGNLNIFTEKNHLKNKNTNTFKLIITDNDDGSPCIRTKCHCFK